MRAVVISVLAILAAAGCGEVELVRDDRVEVVSPADGARVTGPVRLDWTVTGFRPTGFDGSADRGGGAFAVFVDRLPIAPGEDLRSLADDDPTCRSGCPDRDWFARHGVHVTHRTQLLLEALPASEGRRAGDRRRHEITIVLLDGRGSRIGEGAWRRTLYGPGGVGG